MRFLGSTCSILDSIPASLLSFIYFMSSFSFYSLILNGNPYFYDL